MNMETYLSLSQHSPKGLHECNACLSQLKLIRTGCFFAAGLLTNYSSYHTKQLLLYEHIKKEIKEAKIEKE